MGWWILVERSQASDPAWIGLDIGTGGVRAEAFDSSGVRLAHAETRFTRADGSRLSGVQDADSGWRRGVREVLRATATQLGDAKIGAIGLCGIFPGVCLLDEEGRALGPALLYGQAGDPGKRPHPEATGTRQRLRGDEAVFALARFRSTEPEVLQRARYVLGPAGTAGLWLTGVAAIDPHSASRWGLPLTPAGDAWEDGAARLAGLRLSALPRIVRATTALGVVTRSAARATGLPAGTQVVVGPTDSLATVLAAGLRDPGDELISYSSAGCLLRCRMPVQAAIDAPGFAADAHPYDLVVYALDSGLLLDRLRPLFHPSGTHAVMDQRAEAVAAGARGVRLVPYPASASAGPGSDVVFSRYALTGLSLAADAACIWRAALESFGYLLRADSPVVAGPADCFAAGGGAASAVWRQIVTDITWRRQRWSTSATACLGAAAIAGQAVGGLGQATAVTQRWLAESSWRRTAPVASPRAYDADFADWLQARSDLEGSGLPLDTSFGSGNFRETHWLA